MSTCEKSKILQSKKKNYNNKIIGKKPRRMSKCQNALYCWAGKFQMSKSHLEEIHFFGKLT